MRWGGALMKISQMVQKMKDGDKERAWQSYVYFIQRKENKLEINLRM
jgi:hypothetical protein